MSDWEFLHDMAERGYSAQEIAEAAGSGAAPWEWEYLSREWIDSKLEVAPQADSIPCEPCTPNQIKSRFPYGTQEQAMIFDELVDVAARYFKSTGRYLQIWGELGEIYAEIAFGLHRHKPHVAGSDGTVAGKLVEVKTISPERSGDRVLVKRQGNFEQLLIVRIDREFKFQGELLNRSDLKGATGRFLNARIKHGNGEE